MKKFGVLLGIFLSISAANTTWAEGLSDRPSAIQMSVDIVVARPLLLASTALGTGVYVVSLPFSLLGGNAEEAAEVLVLEPAEATFVRCLGCTSPGKRFKETASQ